MSRRHRPSCAGKRRLPTERAAEEALKEARQARRAGVAHRTEKRWYECPDCQGFHLTSRPLRIAVEAELTAAGSPSRGWHMNNLEWT